MWFNFEDLVISNIMVKLEFDLDHWFVLREIQ